MATFILTWNPKKWPWDPAVHAAEVEDTAQGKLVPSTWAVGNRRGGIRAGDRGFLLRQESDRGIIASGQFTGGVYQGLHWDGSNRDANFADLSWDAVLEISDRLPVEILKNRVPSVTWNRIQAGGVQVPSPADAALEKLWAEHLGVMVFHSPEEVVVGTYVEGAVTRVEVNRYERDPAARRACMSHWGTACVVCGLDFASAYGALGAGFIHVHHLRELSTVGPGYTVDPVADMRPVCPNCHAMLHRCRPALTPGALRKRLGSKKKAKKLRP